MKRILYALAILGSATSAFAQAPAHRSCGSHEHLLQQLADHPEMARAQSNIERFTEAYAANPFAAKTAAPIYTIPVVVHVLYNTSAQNISQAQIQSQIDVLNSDYQLLNADAANVPSAFSGLKADAQVQFCLAQRDPGGAATTGVIRKSTTKSSFSADNDDAKSNSTGGSAPWPAGQYLNIWIVPSITSGGQGGILGYAQFPGGPAGTDGVVIAHNYFGTTGTAQAPFNKGRTGTHEVGHWLNLRHIWGDDGAGCSGSDLVGDTPNQGGENYSCPSFPQISCSNGPNGDLFMNYMDYTDDACMYMFTTGQKTRMHSVLTSGGARASLQTSLGCTPPSGSVCAAPTGLGAGSITTSGATISWSSVGGATAYNLQYKTAAASTWTTVNGLAGTAYSITGLASGTSYNYAVQTVCGSSSSSFSGTATFTTTATAPTCSDNYEPNNSLTAAVTMPVGTAITARIGTSTDKDYFKFNNSSAAPKIKITLNSLPFDYDVKLYRGSTLLATSQNGGTTAEIITYNSTIVGTYAVYVYGYNGAASATQCYSLLAQTSASNFREEAAGASEKATVNGLVLFPNPAQDVVYFDYAAESEAEATLVLLDAAGRVVRRETILLEEGANRSKVDVQGLPTGLYTLRLITPTGALAARILVQR